jgi:hypothetical protein
MAKAIKRLIALFSRLGLIKEYTKMVYTGELFSLNQLYSSGHWRTRANLKKKYREIFSEVIKSYNIELIEKFSMVIFYNSRHDPDNITGMEKMFTDVLKTEGVIIDDSKKYCKLYCVVPDSSLPKDTLNFYLINNDNKG